MSGKTLRLFALSTLLTAGSAALGAVAAPVSVTPNGDADAIACRHIEGSSQFSTDVCSHDHAWLDLAADGKPLIDRPTVDDPRGDGDPDAVTCRTPKFVWFGPLTKVCETNRFWAGIAKSRQQVDGRVDIATPWRERGCGGVCDSLRGQGGWSPGSNSFESQSFGGGNTPTFQGYTPPASP